MNSLALTWELVPDGVILLFSSKAQWVECTCFYINLQFFIDKILIFVTGKTSWWRRQRRNKQKAITTTLITRLYIWVGQLVRNEKNQQAYNSDFRGWSFSFLSNWGTLLYIYILYWWDEKKLLVFLRTRNFYGLNQ